MDVTSFSLVYDSFLSKITDDMYLQLDEQDTSKMLRQLLISAIEKFEFPRVNLWDYTLLKDKDEEQEFNIHQGGYFNNKLTYEEINILAVYMIVQWLSQQLASVENTRMKYSGSDFKFTSQANHMQKLLQLKKDYEREGFHLQRLYKRRIQDANGIMRSTFGTIMKTSRFIYKNGDTEISYNDLKDKPSIESHELIGDQTFDNLDMSRIDFNELERITSS